MSNRGYRARSSFDDPEGLDWSYRIGSAATDLFLASRAKKRKPAPSLDATYEATKILAERYRKRRRKILSAENGNYAVRSGPVAADNPKAKNMPPRRRRGGYKRRRVGSRSRSRVGRRRFGRRSSRRRGTYSSRVKRTFNRKPKRYGRKRNLGVYSRAFRNILTKPVKITSENFNTFNNYGPSKQGFCSWMMVRPGWRCDYLDNNLAAHENKTVENVKPTVDICLSRVETFMQIKNMASMRGDVTMYKLYPKRDITANMGSLATVQNSATLIADGAAAVENNVVVAPGVVGLRLPEWDEHDYDITQNAFVKDLFYIKKTMRKFMEPGQFIVLKYKSSRDMVMGKGDLGVNVGERTVDQYQHLKQFGPIWLFRFQGSNVHDKTAAVAGAAADRDFLPTMGSYNFETFRRTKTITYGQIGTASQENIAMITNRLYTMPVANEVGWEIQPQAQAPGAAQPMAV